MSINEISDQVRDLPPPRQLTNKPRFSDRIFRGVVTLGGFTSLLILGLISLFLLYRGFSVLRSEGLGFITNYEWV